MSIKSKKDLKKLLDIASKRKIQKLNPDQKLSLCMIVKNEEENLERCLKSVEGIVDEIVIVDTGSTDNTIEIAKKYGSKVFHYEWENNFGRARNQSIKLATGDWILVLDADEELDPNTKENIRTFLVDINEDIAYQLRIKNLNENNDIGGENYMFRFFKRSPNIRYMGRIHEYLVGFSSFINIEGNSLSIIHHGYKDKNKTFKKLSDRNLPILESLLQEENQDAYKSFVEFYLGSSYFDIGETEKAIEYLKNSINYIFKEENKHLFGIHSYLKLLNSYSFLKKFDEMEELLKLADEKLNIVLDTCDYWYYYALVEKNKNNKDKAIEYFEKAIKNFENPSKSSFLLIVEKTVYYYSNYMIAEMYFETGDYQKTKKYLDKCTTFFEEFNYPIYAVFVAKLYSKINEFEKAIEIYKYLLSKVSDDYKDIIKNHISNVYLMQNKFTEAIRIQGEIHDPNSVKDNWYYLAQTLEDEKIFPSAEEIYSVIIDLLPEEVKAYLGRTVARLIQNKVVDALSDLALARKFAKNKEDLIKIAMIYMQIGQLNQARNTITSIIENDHTDLDANLYLASIEQSEGKLVDAVNRLNAMISLYEKDTKPYVQLGNLFIASGRINEAENIFNKVLEIDSNHSYSYYALAICSLQKNYKNEALENLKKALEIEPDNQGLLDLYQKIENN